MIFKKYRGQSVFSILIFGLIVSIIFTGSIGADQAKQLGQKKLEVGVITGDNVRLRESAHLKSKIITELYKGNLVVIEKKTVGDSHKGIDIWYKVRSTYFYGTGYIHEAYISTDRAKIIFLKKFSAKVHLGKLQTIFSKKEIKNINKYYIQYKKIKNGKDLQKAYAVAESLSERLTDTLNKYYEKRQTEDSNYYMDGEHWLVASIPGTRLRLVAEGTGVNMNIDYPLYLAMSERVKDKHSIAYFNLAIKAYGRENNQSFPNWFDQTWDYGGASNLGSGIHVQLLKTIDSLLISKSPYATQLKLIQTHILRDILEWNAFNQNAKSIVKEINQIIKDVPLADSAIEQLQRRVIEFENPPKNMQLNCKNINCNFG